VPFVVPQKLAGSAARRHGLAEWISKLPSTIEGVKESWSLDEVPMGASRAIVDEDDVPPQYWHSAMSCSRLSPERGV
jgi:hypothetical protein